VPTAFANIGAIKINQQIQVVKLGVNYKLD
jgi:hypothetical protein